jgi:uncharacterized protein YndB with AHSA1/START domain
MNTTTDVSADMPTIVMNRVYDAPRETVWAAMTQPKHVKQWWGGAGFTNPVCEMDVRPGGLWRHVMRFPDGHELVMDFVFLEVEPPRRLVWQHRDRGKRSAGPPLSITTVTLEDLGDRTRWTMIARFDAMEERNAAIAMGFTGPIEASSERLVGYLTIMSEEAK